MSIVQHIRNDAESGAKRIEFEYKDRLLAVARRLCTDSSEAEALVWRTIDETVRRIKSLESEESFFSWMLSIMVRMNSASNRRVSAEKISCQSSLPDASDEMEGVNRIIEAIDGEILRKAVGSLPPKLKESVVLHYFMDIPLLQIAKILSVPKGTVASRLHIARLVLAERLGAGIKKPAVAIAAAVFAIFCVGAVVTGVVRISSTSHAHSSPGPEAQEGDIMAESAENAAAPTAGEASCEEAGGRGETGDGTSCGGPSTASHETDSEREDSTSITEGEAAMTMKNAKAAAVAMTAVSLVATAPATAVASDPYIENANGDQYLNTGHMVGPNTKFVLDYQLNELTLGINPFGAKGEAGTASRPWFRCYLGEKTSGGPAWLSFNHSKDDYSAAGYNVCEADLERHTMVVDLPGKKFQLLTDGQEVASQTFDSVSSGTQIFPLGLFATCAHKSGAYATATATWENPAKMRVYGLEIYESGTLVKKFVPCVKGGVAGLKETISGVFYSGENARSCVAGGDVLVEKDDAYVAFPDNDVMTATAVKGKSMYFDTGYAFTPDTRMELDYALLTPDWTSSSKWAGETYLFFVAGSSAVYLLPYGSSANGRHYMRVGSKEGGITEVGVDYGYNVRRKIVATASNMKMITAGYTNFNISASSGQEVSSTLNSPTLMLGYRNGKTPVPAKIYGLKIYESDALVHDFTPCVSNSVPLLLDTFDPSAKGLPTVYDSPGTNIVCEAGGDIQGDEAAKEAYLDFDGVKGHGIDTGYVLTKDSRIEMDFAVWNNNYAISGSGSAIFFEQRGYKDAESERNGIWFHLYQPDAGRYGWCFADYAKAKNEWTSVYITNERTKFVCDAPANTITAYRGGVQVYQSTNMSRGGAEAITATTCTSTLRIGSNWDGKTNQTGMRLYNVKIYESGTQTRDYVPAIVDGEAGLYETFEGRFFPLEGGKVSGATTGGVEFQVVPQNAKISSGKKYDKPTLSCIASGAQSYEWYADGELVEGETSASISVPWRKLQSPYLVDYSVVPVYTVFNETVKGEPASATVKMLPCALCVIIQ